ncbi:MAG: glycosyltransferase [Clostridia bacterium]|nr:glycosyltransferase [Clostridia bacterium]
MIKTQIVIYLKWLTVIGGVETFIYNWCNLMKDTYDITAVIGNKVSYEQLIKLRKIVRTVSDKEDIECDTAITLRLDDVLPSNIKYKKKIQMIHGCKDLLLPNKHLDIEADKIVAVSEHCNSTYKDMINDSTVIHNPTVEYKPKKVLKLISATRLTKEKGYYRMKQLAMLLKANSIPYIWYVFSNMPVQDDLFVHMNPVDNIKDYIATCDYLVQLSDSESYCYSVVEALEVGVPVIVTPIPVYDELNIREDKERITLDFDMSNVDIDKIYKSKFTIKYKVDNELIRTKWSELLGEAKPFVKYIYKGDTLMKIKMIKNGVTLVAEGNIKTKKNDVIDVTEERAKVICDAGYAVLVKEDKPVKEEKKVEPKAEVVEEAVADDSNVEVAKVKRVTRRKK